MKKGRELMGGVRGGGELHTKSHDGQADGSTSEAVGKTHDNNRALYTLRMGKKEKKIRSWEAAFSWVLPGREYGGSETRSMILRNVWIQN